MNNDNDKNDFDKIGVNTLLCSLKNGRWVFEHKGRLFDFAPAEFTDYCLSPLIIGIDRLIVSGCKALKIPDIENKGFIALFSENYFPNADVLLKYQETKFDGWVYSIEELNFKSVMPGQCAWICPYMTMYYSKPPENIYLKAEPRTDGN
jgi:hypothetical protein